MPCLWTVSSVESKSAIPLCVLAPPIGIMIHNKIVLIQVMTYHKLILSDSTESSIRGISISMIMSVLVAAGVVGEQLLTGDAANEAPTFFFIGLLCLTISAYYALQNDGLLICVLMCGMPYASWWMASMSIVKMYPPSPTGVDLVVRGLITGIIYGGPVGVAGFVLGAGGRRMLSRINRTSGGSTV